MTRKTKKMHHKLVVQYKLVNGSHFFVGNDACEETAGLCVGSRNLKEAFDQVGPALTYLLKNNHGIDAVCVPSHTFQEFRQTLLASFGGDLLSGGDERGFDSTGFVAASDPRKATQWTIPMAPMDLRRSSIIG